MGASDVIDLRDALNRLRVEHEHYKKVRAKARTLLTYANDGTIILVIGPSKAGKTTILADLYALNPPTGSAIPMIVTDATTINKQFSLKHLTYRYLAELRHPLFVVDNLDAWVDSMGPPDMSETRARILLENGLTLRQCAYIGLDECQQMGGAAFALESFKCLVHLPPELRLKARLAVLPSKARRVGIMLGGYEMVCDEHAELMSPHFRNRLVVVHFPRYMDVPRDRKEFAQSLMALDSILRRYLRPGGSLADFDDLIFEGIFGCFGNACNWALAAVAAKEASHARFLRPEHFVMTRLEFQLKETLASIVAGEARMKQIEENFAGFDESDLTPRRPKPRQSTVRRQQPRHYRVGSRSNRRESH